MNLIEIILISIALAMDAVAVSISIGLNKEEIRAYIQASIVFGLFQMIMPIIGYLLSYTFYKYIIPISNIISCIILVILGLNMIIEKNISIKKKITIKEIFILAIATSIDALSIGITLSLTNQSIISSSIMIGLITTTFSMIGCMIGDKLEGKLQNSSKILGGVVLIIIGINLLFK